MEIFQTFAEISVGILGFTAIVIMFKTQHATWNKHIYDGLISHSGQALIYSLLPFILDAYHCKQDTIWVVCSSILGLITVFQGSMVLVMDKISRLRTKIIMFICCFIIGTLQLFNIIGIWTYHEKGPFVIGITWHIIQSFVIFTMIVTKKSEEVNGPEN